MKREIMKVTVCLLLTTCLTIPAVFTSEAADAQSETQGIVELLGDKPVLDDITANLPAAASRCSRNTGVQSESIGKYRRRNVSLCDSR